MRSVENAECGKCGVWKMRSVENEECGKCGVWKMRSVENAECGKCGVWKLFMLTGLHDSIARVLAFLFRALISRVHLSVNAPFCMK